MMPVNPSIILGLKQPKFDFPDPIKEYGESLALKALIKKSNDDDAVSDAFKQSKGDPNIAMKLLYDSGQHTAALAMQKDVRENRVRNATISHTEAQTGQITAGHIAGAMAGLARAGGSDAGVMDSERMMTPLVGEARAKQVTTELMAIPEKRRVEYLISKAMTHKTGQDAVKIAFPNAHMQDFGGSVAPVNTSTMPGATPGAVVPNAVVTPKTIAPGVQAGIDAQDARSRESLEFREESQRRHDQTTREMFNLRKTEADRKTLDQRHQELTQRLTKEGIPSIYSTIEKIDNLLTNYVPTGTKASDDSAMPIKGKDIPGVGMIDRLKPGFMLSSEAQDVRQNVQSLANAILKMRSGSAVTNYEERRVLRELGDGNFTDEAQILKGIQLIKRITDSETKNIGAGFDENVIDEHERRTGLKLPRNKATPTGLPPGSKLIGKTPDGKDVYQSTDGKKWVP